MIRARTCLPMLLSLMCAAGCVTQTNYEAGAPRYSGAVPAPPRMHADTIRIASFNIEFAFRVDNAIRVLASPELRDADVLLLQEMDAAGVERIAAAMGMGYVYYPATKHFRTGRDFGNAVLSRWPIIEDARIVLPHVAAIGASVRTATAATVRVGDIEMRVYSAHLGTVANVTSAERADQLRIILEDAKPYERVIIGGDMNHPDVGRQAMDAGYLWPTRRGPRTAAAGRLDHMYFKGIGVAHIDGSGTVTADYDASDHRPIWALAILR